MTENEIKLSLLRELLDSIFYMDLSTALEVEEIINQKISEIIDEMENN